MMRPKFNCHDCGNKTNGVEVTRGAVSAICESCLQRRKEGKEPAHVREAAKAIKTPRKRKAADAATPPA